MLARWQNLLRSAVGPAAAVVLFSGANLLAYRHFAGQGESGVVFHFINAQLAANGLVVFLLYGLNFEVKERRLVDARLAAVLGTGLALVLPMAGLTVLYTVRQGLLKFGRPGTASPFPAVVAVLALAAVAAVWQGFDAAFVVIAAVAVALPCLTGETAVELADVRSLSAAQWRAGLTRTTLDLSLLVPPFAVNLLTKRYLPESDYLQLQSVFYSLFAMAVITSIGERIIFHGARREQVEREARHWKLLLLLAAYLGVAVLAWFLHVDRSLFWYLAFAPGLAWALALVLAEARARLTARQCLKIGIVWTVAALALAAVLFVLALAGALTPYLVLTGTLVLTLTQLATLATMRRGEEDPSE